VAPSRPIEQLDTALRRVPRAPQELRRGKVEAVGHLQRHRRCTNDQHVAVGSPGPWILQDDNSFECSFATDADRFADHREQLSVRIQDRCG
jgi:hypothetical protein